MRALLAGVLRDLGLTMAARVGFHTLRSTPGLIRIKPLCTGEQGNQDLAGFVEGFIG